MKLHNGDGCTTLNILQTTELCTLNRWIYDMQILSQYNCSGKKNGEGSIVPGTV